MVVVHVSCEEENTLGEHLSLWPTVLKEHKLDSMADNVTKAVFPSLISKLWERSFKPSHVVAVFRSTGLYPLDQAVVQGKLGTSVPFRQPTSPASSTVSSVSASASSSATNPSVSSATSLVTGTLTLQGSGKLVIKGSCKNCGAQLTPMRPHLTLHFQKLLQRKNAEKVSNGKRKRVKPRYYGEALTNGDMYQRLQDEEDMRKQPAKKRRRQSPTPVAESGESEVESHDEGVLITSILCVYNT